MKKLLIFFVLAFTYTYLEGMVTVGDPCRASNGAAGFYVCNPVCQPHPCAGKPDGSPCEQQGRTGTCKTMGGGNYKLTHYCWPSHPDVNPN